MQPWDHGLSQVSDVLRAPELSLFDEGSSGNFRWLHTLYLIATRLCVTFYSFRSFGAYFDDQGLVVQGNPNHLSEFQVFMHRRCHACKLFVQRVFMSGRSQHLLMNHF